MVPVIFVFLGTSTSNAGPMFSEEESVGQPNLNHLQNEALKNFEKKSPKKSFTT